MSEVNRREGYTFGGVIVKIVFFLLFFILFIWFFDWYINKSTLKQRKRFWNWFIISVILLYIIELTVK